MDKLLAALVDQRVCLWWQHRLVVGVLRGVGEGLVCVDLTNEDEPVLRTFIPLTALTGLRAESAALQQKEPR